MDGRNSAGRRISLLNDFADRAQAPPPPPQPASSKFPSSTSSSSTWFSPRHILALPAEFNRSYSSSTTASDPPTPILMRSTSTDSAILQRTPSPLTPNLSLERLSIMSGNPPSLYGKSLYGDPDQLSAAPMPYTLYSGAPQPYSLSRSNPSPPPSAPQPIAVPVQPRPSPPQSTSSFRSRRAPVKSSKNTYPCPLGAQFGCDRYFTTSGHAARHAKIHSGEKNISCPECDKKFARKDNMDQHRKTHRHSNAAGDSDIGGDLSDVESTMDDDHRADLKVSAKLRRARKRVMRSPDPPSYRGLRNESDESLHSSNTTGSESPPLKSGPHQRPRTSSNGSNSLDVLANVALGRTVTYDSDA